MCFSVERVIITHESTFYMTYLQNTCDSCRGQFHTQGTYFPVLLEYESRLVIQFNKSNDTSVIVASKPVIIMCAGYSYA